MPFYLGETFESLKFLYRIPAQTIGKIVPETCGAIVDVLSSDYLKVCQVVELEKFGIGDMERDDQLGVDDLDSFNP